VLGHLEDQPGLPASHIESVEDLGQLVVELHVHDGTDDGKNAALVLLAGSGLSGEFA
jgi:hypothetical protein